MIVNTTIKSQDVWFFLYAFFVFYLNCYVLVFWWLTYSLLQKTGFYSFFNGLIVFHSVCMYRIFFAHPSAAGHLGWFYILPIMNWTLLSIWMLNKQSKIRSISLPNSRTFYRTVMIKTACHWHKIDRWASGVE